MRCVEKSAGKDGAVGIKCAFLEPFWDVDQPLSSSSSIIWDKNSNQYPANQRSRGILRLCWFVYLYIIKTLSTSHLFTPYPSSLLHRHLRATPYISVYDLHHQRWKRWDSQEWEEYPLAKCLGLNYTLFLSQYLLNPVDDFANLRIYDYKLWNIENSGNTSKYSNNWLFS